MNYAAFLLYFFSVSALTAHAQDLCSSFCENFGTCAILDGGPVCECIDQFFTGERCEIDVDACLSSPCLNGGNCTDTLLGYMCDCQLGYTGRQCHINIDDCASSPCVHGTCIDHVGSYTCDCNYGFTGMNCATNIDNCLPMACQNGGSCIDGLEDYSCDCAEGYEGSACEVISDCPSGDNVCENNALCSVAHSAFTCECLPGFTGETCGIEIDECGSSPCQNQATCIDKVNNFTCLCSDGFTGDQCQVDINECASMPCQNGGKCVESDGSNFDCFCKQGFTGAFCHININECLEVNCLNGGTCIDGINKFTCECIPGTEGTHCENVTDPCAILPCTEGGMCTEKGGNYTCECLPYFTGFDCSVELGLCFSQPCMNNATCLPSTENYECICAPGYTAIDCSIEIDECLSNPCQNDGTCSNLLNDYACLCVNGYNGSNCEIDIDDCASNPCVNGTCMDRVNGFICNCELGFTGIQCETELNECNSSPCTNGSTCIDQINGYTCACPNGLTGADCDVGISNCHPSPCENNGTCLDVMGGYVCVCPPGYTGDHCMLDIIDCQEGVCLNNGTCVEGIDSYTCVCRDGFTGKNCDAEIDFCELNPCFGNSTCVSHLLGYSCFCVLDYTGDNCSMRVDDCQDNPCQNGGTCEDLLGTFSCICSSAYTGSECENEIDECQSNPCLHGGNCTDLIADFNCKCPANYYGKQCQIFSTDCSNITCKNGGSCMEKDIGFECLCQNGFMGTLCEIDIDYCVDNECINGANCVDGIQNYTCICADGYNGTYCEIDTDVCDPQPCLNNGICQENETDASFTCTCDGSFQGIICEFPVHNCTSDPCKNNGTCQELDGDGFLCICSPQYTGILCENEVDPCSENPCKNEGLCSPILLDDIPSYVCNCTNSFVGPNCETYNACLEMPCLNNGSCYLNLTEGLHYCQCDKEYVGSNCEQYNHCISDPCENGGTCTIPAQLIDNNEMSSGQMADILTPDISDSFMYMCSCLSGFTGENCEHKISPCFSLPCLNNGECVSDPGSETYCCLCPIGYAGIDCEHEINITIPHFNESSYLMLPGPQHPIESLWVSLNIQITSSEGLVLFAMGLDDDYISISIQNDAVVFKFNIGNDGDGEAVSILGINDMQWHDVTVGWNGIDSYVAVDGTYSDETSSGYSPFPIVHPFVESLTLTSPLFIGSVPNFSVVPTEVEQTKGFQGCMERVSINNEMFDLTNLESGSGQVVGFDINDCPKSIVSLCQPNPCQFGGMCSEFENRTFVCTCPFGTGGRLCNEALNIAIPSFSSASAIAYPALPSNFSVTVTITFLPEKRNGILLYSSLENNDFSQYILVGLVDGHILYVFDTGFGKAVLNGTFILSLDQWHTITISLTGHTGTLQVDGNPTLSKQAPGTLHSVMLHSLMWLGGYSSYNTILNLIGISSGFSGCVSSVIINDQDLDLINSAEMGYGIGNCNDSQCQNNPCYNGATCLDVSNSSFVCECPGGFAGPLCEFSNDPCANPFICLNGGTCQPGTDNQPYCLCPLNKGGDFCEQDITVDLPQFTGSSFLEHNIPNGISFETSIKITFLPTSSTGLILYVGGSTSSVDFLSLLLLNGRVQLRYNLGSSTAMVTSNIVLSLDQWHTVEVSRRLRDSVLIVDSSDTVTGMSSGGSTQLNPTGSTFVGGVSNYDTVSAFAGIMIGFRGCISSLQFNDDPPLGLISDALSARAISQCVSDPCYTQPCLNGGTCLTMLENFVCLCPLGFSGDTCQNETIITWPQFSGISYLEFPPILISFSTTVIYLELRPTTPNGLVLYSTQEDGPDYILLSIKNGLVEFQYDLGSGPALITSDISLTLGDWHTIEASRTYSIGSLSINGSYPVYGSSQGSFMSLQLGESPLYLGGIPDLSILPDDLQVAEGFSGCIREFKAANIAVDLIKDSIFGVHIDQCSAVELCTQLPCLNNGTCIDIAPGYYSCLCEVGFTGTVCEDVITACPVGLPCENGAQCQVQVLGSVLEEYCDCPFPFVGDLCEQKGEFEEARFFGNGYLQVSVQTISQLSSIVASNRIELSVTPSSLEGLLFYMGPDDPSYDDHLYIGLRGGTVLLKYQLGSGYAEVSSTQALHVDEPYNITVERIEKMAKLEISGQESPPIVTAVGISSLLNLDPSRFFIYLGGSPNVTLTSSGDFSSGFSGCILSEVRLGPTDSTVEPIPFNSAISGQSVTTCSSS